jgi:hypothetical protein
MRCVFLGMAGFLGRIDGETRCAFWAEEPVDHGFDPDRLIEVDLANCPSAVVAKEIGWDEVQVDDCFSGPNGVVRYRRRNWKELTMDRQSVWGIAGFGQRSRLWKRRFRWAGVVLLVVTSASLAAAPVAGGSSVFAGHGDVIIIECPPPPVQAPVAVARGELGPAC